MISETFLVAAYFIIWAVLFSYLFFTSIQQQKLARRLEVLEETLTELRTKE